MDKDANYEPSGTDGAWTSQFETVSVVIPEPVISPVPSRAVLMAALDTLQSALEDYCAGKDLGGPAWDILEAAMANSVAVLAAARQTDNA